MIAYLVNYNEIILVSCDSSELKKLGIVCSSLEEAKEIFNEMHKPKVHELTKEEQIEQYIWGCSMAGIEPNVNRFKKQYNLF